MDKFSMPMSLHGLSERRQLFSGHALFGKLPPDDLDALLLHARLERFPAGRVIFGKGSPGRSMMAILKGSVRISTPSPAGPDIVLTILQPGEVFGEYPAIDRGPRSASVEAHTPCLVATFPGAAFRELIESEPVVALAMLPQLVTKIRALTTRVY